MLRLLFDQRIKSDYELASPAPESAAEPIEEAQRFVDAVEAWLNTKPDKS